MIHDNPQPDEPTEFNVAADKTEWLAVLGQRSSSLVQQELFPSFDVNASLALAPFFDAFITGYTGLYNAIPFMTEAHSTHDLSAFIGGLIASHDDDIKLLYMVEKFDKPVEQDFGKQPLTYLVRCAILKR